jgi:non-heme chloroperoxidase
MTKFTVKDGTEIFYKDWGAKSGQPILFSHGWPLSADMWDNQMMTFGARGFHVVAYDRRGFGRSGQNWDGNTNEQFADDIAELIAHLDLNNVVLVGHSMAGGDLAKYVSRHGTSRLSKIVLLGAVAPLLLQTEQNPEGAPMSLFDEMRHSIVTNRAAFFQTMPKQFFGFNRLTHKTDDGLMHAFWHQAMMAGVKPTYDCVAQFSEIDLSEDLKKFDVPTLIIHGDDDQVVPLAATGQKAAKLIPNAELKIYSGGSHAISLLQADQFNSDLLTFIQG